MGFGHAGTRSGNGVLGVGVPLVADLGTVHQPIPAMLVGFAIPPTVAIVRAGQLALVSLSRYALLDFPVANLGSVDDFVATKAIGNTDFPT